MIVQSLKIIKKKWRTDSNNGVFKSGSKQIGHDTNKARKKKRL